MIRKIAITIIANQDLLHKIYEAVKDQNDVFYADDAVDKTGLDAGLVLAALTELEIFGFISSAPGGSYRLS